MFKKFFEGVNKKQAVSWALYDFANSGYFLIIMSFVFPIYFKEVIAGGTIGDFWWGFAVSISTVLAGIVAPIVGSITDYEKSKKQKFIFFALLSMAGTALLYFTGPNALLFGLLIFIFTNLCFEVAQTIYDSLLIRVSSEKTRGRISGFGYGLGYLGGIVAMLLLKPLYSGGYEGSLEILYKLTFPLTALFFLIFSIPAFSFIKKEEVINKKEKLVASIRRGLKNTLTTIKEIKKYKQVGRFLIGFFILNDALVTLFAFIAIYGKTTISLSFSEIAILLIIVQIIAFPSATFLGWLSDKNGPKKILLTTILIWAFIVIGISLATSKTVFYILAILGGFVIGSSQAIARSWFTKIIPRDKIGEFFGFNGFASKIAAVTGPLVFGIISVLTGNQRLAMASLLIYFIVSFLIFLGIREEILPSAPIK